MPRKRFYQPPDLGVEYAYIDIEYLEPAVKTNQEE